MTRRMLLLAGLLAGAAMGRSTWAGNAQVTHVTWTNHDDIPQTVVSRETPITTRSPVLGTDDSFSLTLDTPGTYGFFCSLHPPMQGRVVVR